METMKIEPALTAEEWEDWQRHGRMDRGMLSVSTKGTGFMGLQRVDFELPHPADTECHAIAALALWKQPFGFAREDVRRHRHDAQLLRASLERQGDAPTWDFPAEEMESKRIHAEWHEDMADRIEALLPPMR